MLQIEYLDLIYMVVSDIMMPEMDGIALVQSIKSRLEITRDYLYYYIQIQSI
jgi:CheY-like chemotaxis protein